MTDRKFEPPYQFSRNGQYIQITDKNGVKISADFGEDADLAFNVIGAMSAYIHYAKERISNLETELVDARGEIAQLQERCE